MYVCNSITLRRKWCYHDKIHVQYVNNQPLDKWNLSQETDMEWMFSDVVKYVKGAYLKSTSLMKTYIRLPDGTVVMLVSSQIEYRIM